MLLRCHVSSFALIYMVRYAVRYLGLKTCLASNHRFISFASHTHFRNPKRSAMVLTGRHRSASASRDEIPGFQKSA